jgi:hypothetical protein
MTNWGCCLSAIEWAWLTRLDLLVVSASGMAANAEGWRGLQWLLCLCRVL